MQNKLHELPEITLTIESFTDYLSIERNLSHLTIQGYKIILLDFLQFLVSSPSGYSKLASQGLKGISRQDILEWLSFNKNLKRVTLKKKLSGLRAFFSYLCKRRLQDHNPASRISIPIKEKRIVQAIPETEIKTALDNMQLKLKLDPFTTARNWAILELFYGCGIRRAELIGLNINDIDWNKHVIRVIGKGSKERWVPFGETVQVALQSYMLNRNEQIKNDDQILPLFITELGKRVYPMLIHRIVKTAFSDFPTHYPNHPHAIRHAYATHLIENGADLHSVQELMGHKTILSTEVYVHNERKHLKDLHHKALPRG